MSKRTSLYNYLWDILLLRLHKDIDVVFVHIPILYVSVFVAVGRCYAPLAKRDGSGKPHNFRPNESAMVATLEKAMFLLTKSQML